MCFTHGVQPKVGDGFHAVSMGMRYVDGGVFHTAFGQIGHMAAFGFCCGADDLIVSVQRG